MFVTKKRFDAVTRSYENELEALETELYDADEYTDKLVAKVAELKAALTFISEQRTASANATVTRMADAADKALGITKQADFVAPDMQPEGTLADLRRTFFPNQGTTGTASAHKADLGYTYDYPVMAAVPITNGFDNTPTDTFSGFESGGGSFGGGGSDSSWSSDSCSSSSYDSGSSCDSGGSFD